jgi:hypothetical protein
MRELTRAPDHVRSAAQKVTALMPCSPRLSRRTTGSLVVGAALLTAAMLPTAAPAADASRSGHTLTVTAKHLAGVPRISAGLIGGNLRWVRDADGVITPDGQLRSRIEHLARQLGMESVRYPGGTVGNLFDYRHDLTGPGCQTGGGVAWPAFKPIPASDTQYTIDKDAAFLKAISARSNLMIPMVNRTPKQAKGFVRAMATATGKKHFVVEIGNEPYLDNQHYWRAKDDLGKRLAQYISGGSQRQSAGNVVHGTDAGDLGLFKVNGCNLSKPAVAKGTRSDQQFRTRFTPISTKTPPVIDVNGEPWHYVAKLTGHHPQRHAFTIVDDGRIIQFGDGSNGARPDGPMQIEASHPYTAVRQPGYRQFYRALKSLKKSDGIAVSVCGGWGRIAFAQRMNAKRYPYDCVAVHSYANVSGATTARSVSAALQKQAITKNQELVQLRRAMRSAALPGAAHRFVIVTEYGTLHTSFANQKKDFVNTLYLAKLEIGQVLAGAQLANISNFATMFTRFGTGKSANFAISSAGRMVSLISRMVGQQPVVVRATKHEGVDVLAARSGAATSIFVLNRRDQGSYDPAISVPGHSAASCVTIRRMSAPLGSDDRPSGPAALPGSIRPVRTITWPGKAAFPNKAVSALDAHSLELLTVTPRPTGGCQTPKF